MQTLLRKDLILNWKALLQTYALWSALWLGYPILRPEGDASFDAWAAMVSIACAFLPVMAIAREDKFKAGALACSLPVTREAIVAARYVGGWLVALGGTAVAVAAMSAISVLGSTALSPATVALPVAVIVTIGLVLAVLLPFTLRFGLAGVIGFLVLAQLAGIGLLLAAAMFGAGSGLGPLVGRAGGAIRSLREELGPALFSACLVAAVLALNLASCRLSTIVYQRREF